MHVTRPSTNHAHFRATLLGCKLKTMLLALGTIQNEGEAQYTNKGQLKRVGFIVKYANKCGGHFLLLQIESFVISLKNGQRFLFGIDERRKIFLKKKCF